MNIPSSCSVSIQMKKMVGEPPSEVSRLTSEATVCLGMSVKMFCSVYDSFLFYRGSKKSE